MKILRVADVANNRTGGMSRVMYGSGDAMIRDGHQVDYQFGADLGAVSPPQLRRFVVPVRTARLVSRLQRDQGPYDVVELHEPSAAYYVMRNRHSRELPPCVVLTYGIEARSQAARLAYKRRTKTPVSLKQRVSPWSVILQAQYSLKRADHVVCFNSEDMEFLVKIGRRSDDITLHAFGHRFILSQHRTEVAADIAQGRARSSFLG